MLSCIIVDDEQHCIDRLSSIIQKRLSKSLLVKGICKNVPDATQAVAEFQPDIIFLDIALGNESGFDLISTISNYSFHIIFTTAFDQYAVRAFRFSASDYLLKPIDEDELIQSVGKISGKMTPSLTHEDINVLIENIQSLKNSTQRLCIPDINGFTFVQVSDIIRCQSNANYTTIFMKDNQKFTVSKTLKQFEDLLVQCNFFRVHNSHLINLSHIKKYQRGKGGTVLMDDGTELEVSIRRKEAFISKMLTGG